MSKAGFARSGGGSISKASVARGTINKMITKPESPESVPSNIPGSAAQGVPPAEADKMGDFARSGNAAMTNTIIAAQRGQTSYGPAVSGSVARTGGQVALAPSQFGAWAHPINR